MPRSRRLTAWATLCLFAALTLWALTFLDLAFAGQSVSENDPCPYQPADRVRYGLGGLTFFCAGRLLDGPNLSYPVVLAALAMNTLLLWWARSLGEQARQMLRVSTATLALTLGLGWPTLKVAEWAHNRFLAAGDPLWLSAGPGLIWAQRCVEKSVGEVCQQTARSVFPNPTAWGLLGLGLTGAAGLRGSTQGGRKPSGRRGGPPGDAA